MAKTDQVFLLRSNLEELYVLSIAQYCNPQQIHPKLISTILFYEHLSNSKNTSTISNYDKQSIQKQQNITQQKNSTIQLQNSQQQYLMTNSEQQNTLHVQQTRSQQQQTIQNCINQQHQQQQQQQQQQKSQSNKTINDTNKTVFEDLLGKFSSLQTDDIEFSYLKALALFNPGILTTASLY